MHNINNLKPKLIIFDFDGVLVDSEIIGHRINAVEMSRLGYPLTVEKSIELLTGITKNLFDQIMIQEFGKTIPHDDLMPILQKINDEIINTVKSINSMNIVLSYLEQMGVEKCIVTNGANDYVASILTRTKLSDYFNQELIFSPRMVDYRGKPAPDLFLLAASRFQIDPKDCLVVEDGVLGIRAAKAANMPVIGFLAGSHAQSIWYRQHILKTNPTLIVENSIELLDILKKVSE